MEAVIPESPYATVNEAAQVYRLTPATIRKWCREGGFGGAAEKVGKSWLIDVHADLRPISTSKRGDHPPAGGSDEQDPGHASVAG